MSIIQTETNSYLSPNLFYNRCAYPKLFRRSKPQFIPCEPETILEKCKRYARTVLPLLMLIKPVGSAVTCLSETARTVHSVQHMLKDSDLASFSYHAFQTLLSIGTIGSTLLESSSPLFRRMGIGIKLLSILHETALSVVRLNELPEELEYKEMKLCFNISNNIISMAAILSQEPFLIASSLAIQGGSDFIHGARKAEKGNYFAAGIHVALTQVRLSQCWSIIHKELFANPPLKAHFLEKLIELTFPQHQELISAQEPIKKELTEHESEVKTLFGEEFLYFKKMGPEEKFLILSTETDHNGAFHPIRLYSIIPKLSKKYDVKFRTITNVEDIQKEIQQASQLGRVMGVLIRAHGSPLSMHLGTDPASGWLTSQTISSELFSGLDPQCIIALSSCSTASYPYFSLAYRVANLSQRTTFAADNLAYGITLKQVEPLEWSFEVPGKKVRTKKLEPLEDDSFVTFLKSLFKSS